MDYERIEKGLGEIARILQEARGGSEKKIEKLELAFAKYEKNQISDNSDEVHNAMKIILRSEVDPRTEVVYRKFMRIIEE